MVESTPESGELDAARRRLAARQEELLVALTAGGPVPEGFDAVRLRVQRDALAAKRAGVLARVAPELPEILGEGYRPAVLAYVRTRPMTGGYRQDAVAFARHLLADGRLPDAATRRAVEAWLRQHTDEPRGRLGRLLRRMR
ncbi:hypothetical protein GCM10022245_48340 [Streptomyces mayteni]